MKPITADIVSIQTKNPQSGKDIIVERTIKGEKLNVRQAIVSCKYGQFWLPADVVSEEHNQLNLNMFEEGETFEADRDSRRTKLQGWLAKNVGKEEKDCPLTKDVQDEALYFKGDVVPRDKTSYVATGTQKAVVLQEKPISFDEKMQIMAKYGMTPKM